MRQYRLSARIVNPLYRLDYGYPMRSNKCTFALAKVLFKSLLMIFNKSSSHHRMSEMRTRDLLIGSVVKNIPSLSKPGYCQLMRDFFRAFFTRLVLLFDTGSKLLVCNVNIQPNDVDIEAVPAGR